jgi:hypothetical protein
MVPVLVDVALADKVQVDEVQLWIVVPAGMPVASTLCPRANCEVSESPVTVGLPLVIEPLCADVRADSSED